MEEIVLTVRFPTEGGVLAKDLVANMGEIEKALLSEDEREVFEICHALDLPAYARDAALWRLRQYRGQRLRVSYVRPGCLELLAVVTVATYVVVKKVVDEVFTDSVKKTEIYRRIVDVIAAHIDKKASGLAEKLERSKFFQAVSIDRDAGRITAEASPPPERRDAPPTYHELVERRSKSV